MANKVLIFLPIFAFFTHLKHASVAQVVEYSTKITVNNGWKTTQRSFLIQINNNDQRWMGEVEISHSNISNFKLTKAEIIDKHGNITRKVKKKDITTVSNRSWDTFYQDDLISKFNLHWNDYPYRVRYSYEQKVNEFIHIANWWPAVFKGVETIYSSLEIQIPKSYPVSMDHTGNLKFSCDTLDVVNTMKWEYGLYKSPVTEAFSPPFREQIPRVNVMPKSFKYGVEGSSSAWGSFGEWYSELNKNADELPGSEKLVVDKLIQGLNDSKEIARTLYHYVQDNTSYVNVSIDIGGFKSYPAAYVCQNKYGDCKALTTYMKALLKHAGIESNYLLINTGTDVERIYKKIPGPQFNHVILCVPMGSDTLWLENTSSSLPFNYINTGNQNRNGLFIDGSKSQLIRTPILQPADVLVTKVYHFIIDENGAGKVDLEAKLKGDSFEYFNYLRYFEPEDDQRNAIIDFSGIDDFDCDHWSIFKYNRDQSFLQLYATGPVKQQVKKIGDLMVIQPKALKVSSFEKPGQRTAPLRINYPVNRQDSILYDTGFLKNYDYQLPGSTRIDSKFGEFHISPVDEGNQVGVVQHFKLYTGDYRLEEYPEFYHFIESIKTSQEELLIILTPR